MFNALTRFKFSNTNQNFGELASTICSPILEDFWWHLWWYSWKWSLLYIVKCSSLYKNCITMNPCLPNEQWKLLQSPFWTKGMIIKVQDKWENFNVTGYKVYWYGFRVNTATSLGKHASYPCIVTKQNSDSYLNISLIHLSFSSYMPIEKECFSYTLLKTTYHNRHNTPAFFFQARH